MLTMPRTLVACLTALLPGIAAAGEKEVQWAREAGVRIGQHLAWPRGTALPQKLGATVALVIDRDGAVSDVSLIGRTGSAAADQAALSAVRAASPLPPPPISPGETKFRATMPVMFALGEDMTRWTHAAASRIRTRLTWPKGVSPARKLLATVAFEVNRTGAVSNVRLLRKTDAQAADRAALTAVTATGLLPAPPLPADETSFTATLPVQFSPDFVPGRSICNGC